MKWSKVANELEAQAKRLVDENDAHMPTALLAQMQPATQVTVVAARVAASLVLASLAKALRAGVASNNFTGGK